MLVSMTRDVLRNYKMVFIGAGVLICQVSKDYSESQDAKAVTPHSMGKTPTCLPPFS